jgi:hypothetical protein
MAKIVKIDRPGRPGPIGPVQSATSGTEEEAPISTPPRGAMPPRASTNHGDTLLDISPPYGRARDDCQPCGTEIGQNDQGVLWVTDLQSLPEGPASTGSYNFKFWTASIIAELDEENRVAARTAKGPRSRPKVTEACMMLTRPGRGARARSKPAAAKLLQSDLGNEWSVIATLPTHAQCSDFCSDAVVREQHSLAVLLG